MSWLVALAAVAINSFAFGAPLIVAAALAAPRRYRPVLWALAANVAFHSLIAHKEYRFIILSVSAMILLAGVGTGDAIDWIRRRTGRGTLFPVAIVTVSVALSRLPSGVNRSPPTSGIHSAE